MAPTDFVPIPLSFSSQCSLVFSEKVPKKGWFGGKGEVRPPTALSVGGSSPRAHRLICSPLFCSLPQEDLPWERWTINFDIRTGSTERGQLRSPLFFALTPSFGWPQDLRVDHLIVLSLVLAERNQVSNVTVTQLQTFLLRLIGFVTSQRRGHIPLKAEILPEEESANPRPWKIVIGGEAGSDRGGTTADTDETGGWTLG